MSNLISGKEAWIAKSENKDVQYIILGLPEWQFLSDREFMSWDTSRFLSKDTAYKFRLKPKTIMLNGVEIPAPFEPKRGDIYYFLCPDNPSGYEHNEFNSPELDSDYMQFGAWDSKEKIKEVVKAVKNIFKGE